MQKIFFSLIILGLIVLFLFGCSTRSGQLHDDTQEMVARLDSIARHVDPEVNEYANLARLEYYKQIPPPLRTDQNLQYRYDLAEELLKAGETEQAVTQYQKVLEVLNSITPEQAANISSLILKTKEALALAYLRLGEQQNCLINHSAASCMLPIKNEGIHTLTEGSEMAIELYEQILQERGPDDMISRWLLNIAYMTLGKHPQEVPKQWLIPAEAFSDDHNFKPFADISMATGLAERGLSGGSVTEDFNNDGFVDIFASSWGLDDQLHYFENNGDGSFTKKTHEAGITGIVGGLNVRHADFNNDGFVDLLVLRGAWLQEAGHHPNSLLRNNGDGTFSDVTKSAGLLSFHPTQTAEWADFNNDGWLDLFIGNESTQTDTNPAELFLSQQDGTFVNVAQQAGVDVKGYLKGIATGDYDNDGLTDIYISRLDGQNFLFKNDGPDNQGVPQFTDVTSAAGVAEPAVSFPTWFWDYNNDGWLDLFVSSYDATPGHVAQEYLGIPVDAGIPRLYQNNGDGTFSDVASEVGIHKVMQTMGSNFGDLDNDGYPDFYVGTGDPDFRSLMPNRMFRNHRGERFQEVTSSGGFGHLQKGHGVSFADLDNDGDQDIFTVIGGAFEGDIYMNALFENPGHGNNWITLMFDGDQSNRLGLGNRIQIEVSTPDGPRSIYSTVTTGGSFGSSTLQQEIGLGNATHINQIEIWWPASGKKQQFEDVPMNGAYKIYEQGDHIESIERTQIRLGTNLHNVSEGVGR